MNFCNYLIYDLTEAMDADFMEQALSYHLVVKIILPLTLIGCENFIIT